MESRIRRGGVETPHGFQFEISGGHVALDFANTVDSRPTEQSRELIPTAQLLFSWARQAGLISRAQEEVLRKKAEQKPKEAEAVRRFGIRLRKVVFDLFSSLADGKKVSDSTLSKWNSYIREMAAEYELKPSGDGFFWKLKSAPDDFMSVLWPIVHSAVQLLTGPDVARIRRCASEKCDWLFLDHSKRGNRRWCDMTICGNREKARRFYHKSKSA